MSIIEKGIAVSRAENFPNWYQEVVRRADIAENSPVRGCMILKPYGYKIWELIQKALDKKISQRGVDNVYFPLLIPLSFLEKEAEHVDGFAKECAVVTHHRLIANECGGLSVDPSAELSEPLIIRPTSESMIGHAMARWIQSHRDIPMRLNQWANVMRWEMRPRLLLRTSEFLWQEGHTAHASESEARREAVEMRDVYRDFAETYLRIPVISGEKTPAERFPGAPTTYTIESIVQDGKAVQTATSHFLGQNFSKAYDIGFLDSDGSRKLAWTTSWGASTRLLGAVVLAHSDDDGLVLPPRIAPYHACIVPMLNDDSTRLEVIAYCEQLAERLRECQYQGRGIEVIVDLAPDRASAKRWHWRRKGVPLQLVIGMREIRTSQIPIYRRDKPAAIAETVPAEAMTATAIAILQNLDDALFDAANSIVRRRCVAVSTVAEMAAVFENEANANAGYALASFDINLDGTEKVEQILKQWRVTPRCIVDNEAGSQGICIFSGKPVSGKVLFARAY